MSKDLSEHTPLPWTLSSSFIVCDSEARVIASCIPMTEVPELNVGVRAAIANARLIAAAPDLLAALKEAEALVDKHVYAKPDVPADHPYSVLKRMRAAIARAEGR